MKIRWRQLLINLVVWAIAEIMLNLIGLETLANYGEYLGDHDKVVQSISSSIIIIYRIPSLLYSLAVIVPE